MPEKIIKKGEEIVVISDSPKGPSTAELTRDLYESLDITDADTLLTKANDLDSIKKLAKKLLKIYHTDKHSHEETEDIVKLLTPLLNFEETLDTPYRYSIIIHGQHFEENIRYVDLLLALAPKDTVYTTPDLDQEKIDESKLTRRATMMNEEQAEIYLKILRKQGVKYAKRYRLLLGAQAKKHGKGLKKIPPKIIYGAAAMKHRKRVIKDGTHEDLLQKQKEVHQQVRTEQLDRFWNEEKNKAKFDLISRLANIQYKYADYQNINKLNDKIVSLKAYIDKNHVRDALKDALTGNFSKLIELSDDTKHLNPPMVKINDILLAVMIAETDTADNNYNNFPWVELEKERREPVAGIIYNIQEYKDLDPTKDDQTTIDNLPNLQDLACTYLSYDNCNDPNELRLDTSPNILKYAGALQALSERHGFDSIQELANNQLIQNKLDHCHYNLRSLGIRPSSVANNRSWLLWDMAKQYYLYTHPKEAQSIDNSEHYSPKDPLLSKDQLDEIVHRHTAWETYNYLKSLPLEDRGAWLDTYYPQHDSGGESTHRSTILSALEEGVADLHSYDYALVGKDLQAKIDEIPEAEVEIISAQNINELKDRLQRLGSIEDTDTSTTYSAGPLTHIIDQYKTNRQQTLLDLIPKVHRLRDTVVRLLSTEDQNAEEAEVGAGGSGGTDGESPPATTQDIETLIQNPESVPPTIWDLSGSATDSWRERDLQNYIQRNIDTELSESIDTNEWNLLNEPMQNELKNICYRYAYKAAYINTRLQQEYTPEVSRRLWENLRNELHSASGGSLIPTLTTTSISIIHMGAIAPKYRVRVNIPTHNLTSSNDGDVALATELNADLALASVDALKNSAVQWYYKKIHKPVPDGMTLDQLLKENRRVRVVTSAILSAGIPTATALAAGVMTGGATTPFWQHLAATTGGGAVGYVGSALYNRFGIKALAPTPTGNKLYDARLINALRQFNKNINEDGEYVLPPEIGPIRETLNRLHLSPSKSGVAMHNITTSALHKILDRGVNETATLQKRAKLATVVAGAVGAVYAHGGLYQSPDPGGYPTVRPPTIRPPSIIDNFLNFWKGSSDFFAFDGSGPIKYTPYCPPAFK